LTGLSEAQVADIAERAADRATRQILLTLGVDVDNPLDAQRDFAVMREVGRLAMDAEFRKDLEHARDWRRAMEEPDGISADLAHTRRWRKIVEASSSKGVLTGVGILVTGAISMIVIGVQRVLGMH
jgi:hypothetical protein